MQGRNLIQVKIALRVARKLNVTADYLLLETDFAVIFADYVPHDFEGYVDEDAVVENIIRLLNLPK